MAEIRSIGLFIDGGYFAKINEPLKDSLALNINLTRNFFYVCVWKLKIIMYICRLKNRKDAIKYS